MAEIPPPQLGSWTFFAFVQGPLVEEIGEFLGKIVPIQRGVDAIGKVMPLPFLQKVFKKTREATETQQKEDGKRVIKLHTAISITESWLRGLTGTGEEIVDLLHEFSPAPGLERKGSLADRIAQDLRDHALPQNKPKYVLERPPNKQGKRKGVVSDWTRRKVGDHRKRIDYGDTDYPAPIVDK
jgi:hypothetical protein